MAKHKNTTPEVENNRPLLQSMAKNLVDKIYGPDGPPIGTKFVDLEDLVVELGRVFQKIPLGQALSRQAKNKWNGSVNESAWSAWPSARPSWSISRN